MKTLVAVLLAFSPLAVAQTQVTCAEAALSFKAADSPNFTKP
jgi:hypothetical protein